MERLATDMIHVLNSGEMNVFRLGLLLLLAGHDVFRMWINQCIPDGRIEARWIACVRRASVCCVRIIPDFHGSDVRATRRSSGIVNRHRLPRLCKNGGAELEPFTRCLTSRASALAAATCQGPAFSLSTHTLAAFDSNSAPGLNARIFQSDR
jgi:hypothetical protein